MIACIAEHLAEERIVTPVALVSDSVGGHHELEDIACEVPWRDDIREGYELSPTLQLHLSWCCRPVIAIELRVAFAVCLSDDEHYLGRTERAAVHPHILRHSPQHCHLACGKMVGIDTESHTVHGHELTAAILLRQLVLDTAYRVKCHERMHSTQIVAAQYPTDDKRREDKGS